MLGLADIRDYIKNFKLAENYYIGKLDNKEDKSIGVYQRKSNYAPRKCIGNTETYERKPISILLHWNNNARETEEQAFLLYEQLEQIKNTEIGNEHIFFVDVLNVEPIDVGTDDAGVYERIIEVDFYYEKWKGSVINGRNSISSI